MKIGIVTNIRSPYRKLQIEEFTYIKDIEINVYYTNSENIVGRKWNVDPIKNVNEYILNGYKLFKEYGHINKGLLKVVFDNDLIIIGGYQEPTYIILSILCRLCKKPYVILFDGISPSKINNKENIIKFILKKIVISGSSAVFGNGTVAKLYFGKKFNYNVNRIFNQYLTVDVEKLLGYKKDKNYYRKMVRERYKIDEYKNVIIYSGRLIKRKNVNLIIEAISKLTNKNDYVLLILGDGEEKNNLINLATQKDIHIIISGFISNQEELFKCYFAGDLLVLPSYDEPWGLVINEAMAAGLPVISSDQCGASLDLVKNSYNGYSVEAGNVDDLIEKIKLIFKDDQKRVQLGEHSKEIIKNWTFKESRKSFEKLLIEVYRC